MSGVDAGSISSSIRIKLAELNADIAAARTAFDNLGTEFAGKAEKYSTLGGKKYVNALKTVSNEMRNVESAARAGALSESQAVERLIALRKRELQILQDKAVKEGTASSASVAAINKSQGALSALEDKQKLLAKGAGGGEGGLFGAFAKMRDVMLGPVAIVKEAIAAFSELWAKASELEDEFLRMQKAEATLDAVLKSTGAEAWTTREHLVGLAESIQGVTGRAKEETVAMQAVLLGFRNIRGDNFDRATQSIIDMAAVMKTDLTATAQSVGKALDMPVEGMDSLSRQGFKFSRDTKELIKTLVEAGKVEEAQNIILDELAKTFGGAAAAQMTLKDKVKITNDELREEAGRAVASNGFLETIRLAWVKIGGAITDAMKAQNDYKDGMNADKKIAKGTATIEDYDKKIKQLTEDISLLNKMQRNSIQVNGIADESITKQMEALNKQRNEAIDNKKALQASKERKTAAMQEAEAQSEATTKEVNGKKAAYDILSEAAAKFRQEKYDADVAALKAAVELSKKETEDRLKEVDAQKKAKEQAQIDAAKVEVQIMEATERERLRLQRETWKQLQDTVKDVVQGIADIYASQMQQEIDDLTYRYDQERELIENNGRTKEQALQDDLTAAQASGDEERIKEAQKNLALYKLDQEYEKKRAKLQYQADVAQWEARLLVAQADAAMAIMKVWSDAGNGPYWVRLALTGLVGASSAVQTAAILASRPQPPRLATGGIVLPRSGGVETIQAENGYPELSMNLGPSGAALMGSFAQAIVDKMTGGGDIAATSTPVLIDGIEIARIVTRFQRNNQV